MTPKSPLAVLAGWLAPLGQDLATGFSAILAFLAGAATLIAAANPGAHPRAVDLISLIAVEAPSLLAALVGLAQMALADGLRRRVDASMALAAALSFVSASYFVLHHERYVDASLQLFFVAFLLVFRRSFYRRARAFSLRMPSIWIAAIAAAIIVAFIAAILWTATHPAFTKAPFIVVIVDPILGRAGRPVALACGAFALFLFWRYAATVERKLQAAPAPGDYAKAAAAIARADDQRPEALLSFTGDLSLLFSETGTSFVPYSAYGSSLVALGGPVGPADERRAILSAFCDMADAQNLKPVVYAAAPLLLPTLIDLGFRIEKIGENAIISLEEFSLAGKALQPIRYANRKLTSRDGAHFEIHRPPHSNELLERLKPVSDAWLAHQKTGEKRFSLGRFEPAFLSHCVLAVATISGKPNAFGSILVTPDNEWAALDLMRYDQSLSPPGTMDFLLSEILLWAKESGIKKFDLSMAPLSGLAEEKHAPLFARFGRLIYEQGGRWYNFEGLRAFKEKFRPNWEPRYMAAKGAFSLPVALAEIAMLTNSSPREQAPG